jgi:hypothetical protein
MRSLEECVEDDGDVSEFSSDLELGVGLSRTT